MKGSYKAIENLSLTATDLSAHLGCHHLTQFSVRVKKGEIKRPFYDDPTLELLREKGNEHEKAYLEYLRSQGRSIKEFSDHGSRTDQALAAMRQGLEKVQKQAWVQLEGRRGKHPYHETIQPECIALTRAAIVVVGVGKAIRNLE